MCRFSTPISSTPPRRVFELAVSVRQPDQPRPDQQEGRIANVGGALLTGGASTRMGSDKAHMEIGGVPAATRLARLLDAFFEDVILVGGNPPASAPGRRVPDPEGPNCALRGLVAALEATRAERVLVLATDLPLVTAELLLALVAWPLADVVVPRAGGRVHPLCALYRRDSVLSVARENLAGRRLALQALLDAVDVEYLDDADLAELDRAGTALTNVNDPEDLRRVKKHLGSK